jgi:hypothetical protein
LFVLFLPTFFAVAGRLRAGPVELEPKEMAPAPSITSNEPWYFNIASPGWLAGVSGVTGLHGVDANVDLGFDQLIKSAAGLMSLSVEARKGRFGFYGDFLWMTLKGAVYPEGVVSKANLDADQWLADAEVYYRVVEGPRGWLDLRVGARYTDLYSYMKLFGNSGLMDDAATDLVNAASEDVHHVLDRLLKGVLDGHNYPVPIPPLGFALKAKLEKQIIAAKQDPLTAHQKIVTVLNKGLNTAFSLTERWVDPYIGIDGRYNLTKAFYLTGRADVGGFTAGSDITTQAYAGVGCQITRYIYSELGFRYLYANYEDDSNRFIWRMSTYGPQITTGIIF